MSTGSYRVKLREETAEREAVITEVTPDVTGAYENPLPGNFRERRTQGGGPRSPSIQGAGRAGRVADRTEWKEPKREDDQCQGQSVFENGEPRGFWV